MCYYDSYTNMFLKAKNDTELIEYFQAFLREYDEDLRSAQSDPSYRDGLIDEYNSIVQIIKQQYKNASDTVQLYIELHF